MLELIKIINTDYAGVLSLLSSLIMVVVTIIYVGHTKRQANYAKESAELVDYSGVCLLITKALEVETTKRFFTGYKDYLRKKYWSISCWPYALRKRDNNGEFTENEIQESEFTLGSVVSVFGLKRTIDDFGSITGFEVARPKPRNDFIDYARSVLFRFSDRQRVAAEIDKDCRFIEKVRLDYRNPAAHRDRLSITSAKECMEYVIDVQHMLKEMLYVMKI
jgi:hypothetical protein